MSFSRVKGFILGKIRKFQKISLAKKLPLNGYKPGLKSYVDNLSDEDLSELNGLLDWNSFISDANGRRFGMVAWGSKRIEPQEIPDKRIVAMHQRFNLNGQHVLEVGCFEGVHTLGLLQYAGKVTAVDSRMDHVVKTIVRCGMHEKSPAVFKCDVELKSQDYSLLACDFIHHVGVLYHLRDPISHLLALKHYVKKGVMLDTHYSLSEEADSSYIVDGREYSYKRYMEYGKKESFSGMYDHSKWLLLDDIVACLKQCGFDNVEIVEKRSERNGPRVLLYAST
ncbi:MAG: class I SAM-dependent methyltransferase [Methylotenera sp.]|uniref:class I SAM-dependent methyltransferase n=1 Tax=Methylotenera sp. TaxID=2051956 RepID=UPI00248A6E24|nr:class I SAM-dependent methyltransferase [Methylotenera sp.]MDI1307812.1 class I SAM-dependent methyltransferase [Methylotenera sp.]